MASKTIDYSLFSAVPVYFIGHLFFFFAIYTDPRRIVHCYSVLPFNRVRFPSILASQRITERNPLTRHVLYRTNSVASRFSTSRHLITLTSQVRYRRLCTAHVYAPSLPSTSRDKNRVCEKVTDALDFYGICRVNFSPAIFKIRIWIQEFLYSINFV